MKKCSCCQNVTLVTIWDKETGLCNECRHSDED